MCFGSDMNLYHVSEKKQNRLLLLLLLLYENCISKVGKCQASDLLKDVGYTIFINQSLFLSTSYIHSITEHADSLFSGSDFSRARCKCVVISTSGKQGRQIL